MDCNIQLPNTTEILMLTVNSMLDPFLCENSNIFFWAIVTDCSYSYTFANQNTQRVILLQFAMTKSEKYEING